MSNMEMLDLGFHRQLKSWFDSVQGIWKGLWLVKFCSTLKKASYYVPGHIALASDLREVVNLHSQSRRDKNRDFFFKKKIAICSAISELG